MKVSDVYDAIDAFAPFDAAEKWDNSGLLIGNPDSEAGSILCTLDLDDSALGYAVKNDIKLIVTHHPVMFSGIKRIRTDTAEGRIISTLIKNDISLIAAHTSLDKADRGVSFALAANVGLKDIHRAEEDTDGYLRLGTLETPLEGEALRQLAGQRLGDVVRMYGGEKIIKTVAVCGGAGGEYAYLAKKLGADAYLTGEMRYHDSQSLALDGFCTLQAGHDASEKPVLRLLADILKQRLNTKYVYTVEGERI